MAIPRDFIESWEKIGYSIITMLVISFVLLFFMYVMKMMILDIMSCCCPNPPLRWNRREFFLEIARRELLQREFDRCCGAKDEYYGR